MRRSRSRCPTLGHPGRLEFSQHLEKCFLRPRRNKYPVRMQRFLSSIDYLMRGLGWGVGDRARLDIRFPPTNDDLAVASSNYPELICSFMHMQVTLACRRDGDCSDRG